MAAGWESAVAGLMVIVGALILLSVAAFKFGVDSRDGNDWAQHRRV